MNTEERLVSYQVNECLKQRDELRAEVERMRTGWDADVDWANKLLQERDEARAELERLRAMQKVGDPACSDPMCSYRAEAWARRNQ